ncbi:MAG: hypothetical protein AAGI38_21595, partial [Bacteroidota bacterium]
MPSSPFTQEEQKDLKELFDLDPEQIEREPFEKARKALRLKYHPDRFEKYDDEVVREMANQRFKRIEALSEKVEAVLDGNWKGSTTSSDVYQDAPAAVYAFDDMKIEVITRDKDLKYRLFGTRYRWLEKGDRFKIPKTKASIIIDNEYAGRSMGFNETIRMYLTFGEEDDLELIVGWLYESI